LANQTYEKKTIRQEERDGSSDLREYERERNNEFLFGVWMRHFKTQNERVFLVIYSDILCRHLQTMQDQKARWKLLT
jgi:hypothetical protein